MEKDLTEDDISTIRMLTINNMGLESIRMRLPTQYKYFILKRRLLKRMISKELGFIYGKNIHHISELNKHGDEIKVNGGIFENTIFHKYDMPKWQTSADRGYMGLYHVS